MQRYGAEIIDDVLVGASDIDFFAFESTDFEHFYQRALDRSHKRKKIGYKASRIDDFHAFGVQTYDFARLPEPLNDQSNASHVKAIVIPECVFSIGRDQVMSLTDYDVASRESLWTLITVLHRAGLRRGDALSLRLGDLDPGDTFWLRISDNEYADTKRSKSHLPLTPLLLPNERDRVHTFLYDRLQSGDGERALVFHPTGTPKQPWDQYMFSKLYASLIRCDEWSIAHTPHDSRHTCFSQLQLVIENQPEWIERLTPYSAEQVGEIRAAILQATDTGKNHYWSLASLCTHTTPQTTLSNYLHYTDLMVYAGIRDIQSPLSFGQVKNLGNTTTRVIDRWSSKAGVASDAMTIGDLGKSIEEDLAQFVKFEGSRNDIPATEAQIPALYRPFKRSSKDLDVAYRELKRHYNGTPIEVIVQTTGISRCTIVDWIENCDFIGSMPTRKRASGTLRHISISRSRGESSPQLPPPPKHQGDKKLLSKLMASIDLAADSCPDDLRAICQLWLTRSTISNSGLPLDTPSSLACILAIFGKQLPAKRWRLHLLVPSEKDMAVAEKEWRCSPTMVINVSVGKPNQTSISAWLYLRHPDEESMTTMTKIAVRRTGEAPRLPMKFSSMLIRYLLFMTTIVLFSPDDVRRMAKNVSIDPPT